MATLAKFRRGNLNCTSEAEGRRKLKFGEVSVKIGQSFFERKPSKKSFDLNALLT